MTDESKIKAALADYKKFRELQASYFRKSAEYAHHLGAGTATKSLRLDLVAAKDAYYTA